MTWSLCTICVHYIFKTYSRFLCPVSLHNKSKSWIDALEDCQRDHFSLVEICEKKVRDDVKRLQNKTDSKTGVWIGLQRSVFGYRPEWKWISGYNVVKSQLNRTSSTNSDFDNHCGKVIFDNKTSSGPTPTAMKNYHTFVKVSCCFVVQSDFFTWFLLNLIVFLFLQE